MVKKILTFEDIEIEKKTTFLPPYDSYFFVRCRY